MTGDEVAMVILRGLKLWVALLEKALGIMPTEKQPKTPEKRNRRV